MEPLALLTHRRAAFLFTVLTVYFTVFITCSTVSADDGVAMCTGGPLDDPDIKGIEWNLARGTRPVTSRFCIRMPAKHRKK